MSTSLVWMVSKYQTCCFIEYNRSNVQISIMSQWNPKPFKYPNQRFVGKVYRHLSSGRVYTNTLSSMTLAWKKLSLLSTSNLFYITIHVSCLVPDPRCEHVQTQHHDPSDSNDESLLTVKNKFVSPFIDQICRSMK